MKILVYGAGVIGGCLAHCLCRTKNDITVLARGHQKETLEKDGLVVKNHFSKKVVVSHPQVIDELRPDDRYDIIFVVMQYMQMKAVLPFLAANCTKTIVFVGNNMDADNMESILHEKSSSPKTVVMGFQGTGGERQDGHYTYVAFGKPGMSIGSSAPQAEWLPLVQKAFEGSGYRITPCENMDAWYKSHAAFVLPVCYMIYKNGGTLRGLKKADINLALDASLEGTLLLKHLGYPVPEDDLVAYTTKRRSSYLFYWICVHTKIGELAASRHANNAVGEMIALNEAFDAIKAQALDYKMDTWNELEQYMPRGQDSRNQKHPCCP